MSDFTVNRRPKESILSALKSITHKIVPIAKGPITKVLEYRGKKWIDVVDKSQIDRTNYILELTKTLKPEKSGMINEIISDLGNIKLVYDENNNWSYINKLNTNYSDLAVFISDLLEECTNKDVNKIYREIKTIPNPDISSLAEILSMIPNHAEYIWEKFLSDTDRYTQNAKKNTLEGSTIEKHVVDYFINSGWELIHVGGNGDIIDMKLGVDIIVKKNEEYQYVQVKKVSSITEEEIGGKIYVKVEGSLSEIRNLFIDCIVYGTLDGNICHVTKQEYYYQYNNEFLPCFGYPIPNRSNQNKIFIEKK